MTTQLSRHEFSRRQFIGALTGLGAVVATGGLASCARDTELPRLALLNWNDYVAPDTLSSFTKESGVDVAYQTYESNDELARLLRSARGARRGGRKGTTYDLAVPSGASVSAFIREGLVQKLDRDVLTDQVLSVLRPDVLGKPFDPNNEYSIPWATGTTAIGYDMDVFATPPDWSVFEDDTYTGRVTLLDEKQEALSAALLKMGKDPNSVVSSDLEAAGIRLGAMLRVARLDSSEQYWRNLADGKVVAAQGFSSDIALARDRAAAKGRRIGFVIPRQGALRWIDSMVIPDGAPRPKRAHEFIKHMLDPKVAAALTTAVKADTGNGAGGKELAADVLADSFVFPSADDLARAPFAVDLGDAQSLWDRAWKTATAK